MNKFLPLKQTLYTVNYSLLQQFCEIHKTSLASLNYYTVNSNLLPSTIVSAKSEYLLNGVVKWRNEYYKNNGNYFSSFLNYKALYTSFKIFFCVCGSSMLVYSRWKRRQEFDFSWSLFSTIHAAQSFDSTNRNKFNFIADVVEKTAPAVVYIEILDKQRYTFGTSSPITVSNGSGFIVESDGLILTNAHVVIGRPNSIIKVKLYNNKEYYGVIEDVDSRSDLATIRIKQKNLPTLKLGNSSSLRPGEWVAAIGSPLALSNTITTGVVSSVARGSKELGLHFKDMDYIQTDAAITFGNSGGPLVNLDGEVIGINSMRVTAGISFAIPSDHAKQFLQKSKMKHKDELPPSHFLHRRFMGITMLTLTPNIILELQQRSQSISSSVSHGVLVWRVIVGSPAFVGGLQPGDVVTHINDKPIMSAADVYKALEESNNLEMIVVRKTTTMKLTIIPED